MIVEADFFRGSTLQLAKRLLGTYLVHESEDGTTIGRIVETEAYLSKNDPACHAARGQTPRNAPMFGPAGMSYVYLIYGMHYCFNVVSGKPGVGEAVLLRALEPVEGIDLMSERRDTEKLLQLCSGPAKLVEAMGITKAHNAVCLRTSSLKLHRRESFPKLYGKRYPHPIVETTRIGISSGQELQYRFYLENSSFVSKR